MAEYRIFSTLSGKVVYSDSARMANCEHLAAENMGQSKFDWAERTLKQQRGIREEAEADRWVWQQWVL